MQQHNAQQVLSSEVMSIRTFKERKLMSRRENLHSRRITQQHNAQQVLSSEVMSIRTFKERKLMSRREFTQCNNTMHNKYYHQKWWVLEPSKKENLWAEENSHNTAQQVLSSEVMSISKERKLMSRKEFTQCNNTMHNKYYHQKWWVLEPSKKENLWAEESSHNATTQCTTSIIIRSDEY